MQAIAEFKCAKVVGSPGRGMGLALPPDGQHAVDDGKIPIPRKMRSPSLMLRDTSPVRRGTEGAPGWGMGLDRQAILMGGGQARIDTGGWGWIHQSQAANGGRWGWITRPGHGVGSPGRYSMGLQSQAGLCAPQCIGLPDAGRV